MSDNSQNNKRIAKNTAFLYLRMLLVMGVALYTTRVIFKVLGAEDMGIYNVVGGLTISFAFFSSSLSNATQRFLNMELGKDDISGANKVFCLSIVIYATIVLAVLIFGEFFGIWFVENKMVIPVERLDAAIFVLHTTLIGLAVTLISSVFDSVLIARENMKIYAYIGVVEVILKLVIVYMLEAFDYDKLKLYAFLYLAVHTLIKSFTVIYCIRNYSECKFRFYWNQEQFKEMFSFIGWNGFSTAVWMVNEQGTNILLNLFFGPIVNASRAISAQVSNALNNFSNNFFVAVRPQIIKSYAAQNYEYLKKLIYSSSKYSFYLKWMLCLPIISNCNTILTLWLKDVPQYAVEFVQWILIFSCINVLNNPIWTAIQATGNLKRYTIVGSIIFLLAFPASYIFLKMGMGPVIVFQMLVLFRAIYVIVCFRISQKYIDIKAKEYLTSVVWPICKVVTVSATIVYLALYVIDNSITGLIVITMLSIIATATAILLLGITKNERSLVTNFIRKKIKR